MADTDGEEGERAEDVPEEDLDDEQRTLLHVSKYVEARRALPWAEWTFREKIQFCMDRIFLAFLAICLIVFLGEFIYKMWYVTNVKKIIAFVSDSVTVLFNWLSTEERNEELFEL